MTTAVLTKTTTRKHEVRITTIAQDWRKVLYVFVVMSIIGLVGETLQHYIAFGEWEHRAGFIWGPFSPIYGLAAVLLTIVLEPIGHWNAFVIFVAAGLVGGGLEYFASWAMETFWGVVAWSYLDAPLNFNGRTDIFHMIVWGLLGLAWVKLGLPLTQWCFEKVNQQSSFYKVFTGILAVFMALDVVVTVTVMLRCDARANGLPAANAIEQVYDIVFTDEVLQDRFNNMGGIGMP